MILDTHVHLWAPEITPLSWLAGSGFPERVTLCDVVDAEVPTRVVLVTADADAAGRLAEARAFSDLAVNDVDVHGFVAGVSLVDGTLSAELDVLATLPGWVGVRHNLQDVLASLPQPDVVAGLRTLAEVGVPFDLCVRAHELGLATTLVEQVPELVVVLDHLGKPPVGDEAATARWRDDLTRLARRPRTWCKLSGLRTECPPGADLDAVTADLVGHALTVFGVERCVLGSDRPITTDPDWFSRVLTLVPEGDHHLLTTANASTIYRRTP